MSQPATLHEEEALGKAYDRRLMRRLLTYVRPYRALVAGALVGTVGALMVRRYFALRRLGFSVGPDGALHQYPGPSLKRIKAVARERLAP